MTNGDERFQTGAYPSDPSPSPVLRRSVDEFPDETALDVATGTGQDAIFLTGAGDAVDAFDRFAANELLHVLDLTVL